MEQLSMNGLNMKYPEKSVYEQYPDIFDEFKKRFPNIFALSKVMVNTSQMNDAMGASRGCVEHWVNRRNEPGSGSERRAGKYLVRMSDDRPAQAVTEVKPAPPVSASMFLVSVPESAKVKADMLMNMMRNIGCEIVDF